MTASGGDFDGHLAAWHEYQQAPWGRVRYAVVAHNLSLSLAPAGAALRVLDVGGGDGRDALALARSGHEVTVLDTAGGMLRLARDAAEGEGLRDRLRTRQGSLDDLAGWPGESFDVVLCHFLLQYRQNTQHDVGLLARMLTPGGRLSLIAPNPAGLVLAAAARCGPAEAKQELARDVMHTTTFDQTVRKIEYREAIRVLDEAGLSMEAQYGGRCVNDIIINDAAKWDQDYYQELEDLEITLSGTEPYTLIGQFWHLVARLRRGAD